MQRESPRVMRGGTPDGVRAVARAMVPTVPRGVVGAALRGTSRGAALRATCRVAARALAAGLAALVLLSGCGGGPVRPEEPAGGAGGAGAGGAGAGPRAEPALAEAGAGRGRGETVILVAAAASLQDALQDAAEAFRRVHPAIRVQFTFGSSGALAAQVEAGAPVDLFVAAGRDPVDRLVRRGLADPGAVRVVAGNRLVLVVPAGRPMPGRSVTGRVGAGRPTGGGTGSGAGTGPGAGSGQGAGSGAGMAPEAGLWMNLAGDGIRRIALGDPAHVPAGRYGRQVLEHLGLWARVQPKLVLDQDVRQVLQHVAAGAADAGIVYATDAATAKGVAVVAEAPPGSHEPIVYPLVVPRTAVHPEAARALADWLAGAEGQAIFARYGFLPPP
ncbi:molybdenum ABC transporter, periplasmic molybdate-binding protein [Thermaerobacter marianensis DSM 12885]|uniref:Molybdenum ABC transporter, periplasmic molybdate-binding protein n=1 Tax=Thermaerobacter marianensis (strain ATCC 700841 / DSM 12885 / JCM 10246 / 7p75a) TaxID=644966 RepID=E6SGP2_THEM7|nr:molybdate ABC transporter substrate-binding protein [Thermaerobacter marianensis]ADU50588.1 molybdenum ABC transporter, periplasmic molybdate-binding protein [Thermaerobacter marianensis DSM 12885]